MVRKRASLNFETVENLYVALRVLQRQLDLDITVDWGQYQHLVEITNQILEARHRVERINRVPTASQIEDIGDFLANEVGLKMKVEDAVLPTAEVAVENVQKEEVDLLHPETDLSTHALNKAEIDALMVAYEAHLAKMEPDKSLMRTARDFHVSPSEIQRLIERKIQLQAEIEKKLMEQGLVIDVDEAREMASQIARKEVVIEGQLEGQKVDVEKVRAEIEGELIVAAFDDKPEILDKTSETIERILKSNKVGREVVEEVIANAQEAVAEAKVKRLIEQRTVEIVSKLGEEGTIINKEKVRVLVANAWVDDQTTASEIVRKLETDGVTGARGVEVEIQRAVTEAQNATKTPGVGRTYKSAEGGRGFVEACVRENPAMNPNQYTAMAELVLAEKALENSTPNVPINASNVNSMISQNMPELRLALVENNVMFVQKFLKMANANPVIAARYAKAQEFLEKKVGVILPTDLHGRASTREFHMNQRLQVMLANNPQLARMMVSVERVMAIQTFTASLAVRFGAKAALQAGIEFVGRRSVDRFASLTIGLMGRYGSENGLMIAMGAIVSSAAKVAADGTVKKVALTGLSKIMMAAGGLGGPPGWLLTAALMVGEFVVGKVVTAINKVNEMLTGNWTKGLQQDIKNTLGKIPLLGEPLQKVVNLVIGLVELTIGLLGGLLMAPIAVIVVGVFIGIFVMQMLTGGMVSSLVPPVGLGGGQISNVGQQPPNGWQNTPIPLPDWNGGPIAEGCPQGLPVDGGRLTQGPSAPGCSHQGMSSPAIDIGIAGGTPIRAINSGLAIAQSNNVYGFYVTIEAKCGNAVYRTLYAHMIGMPFSGKKQVKAGDVIGYVDNTGNSTGNHLHLGAIGLSTSEFLRDIGFSQSKAQQAYMCCIGNGKACPSL